METDSFVPVLACVMAWFGERSLSLYSLVDSIRCMTRATARSRSDRVGFIVGGLCVALLFFSLVSSGGRRCVLLWASV